MTTEAQTASRKAYWARMTPEQRSARMRAIALTKQKKLTFKQKRDHALKMVEARRANKRAAASSVIVSVTATLHSSGMV